MRNIKPLTLSEAIKRLSRDTLKDLQHDAKRKIAGGYDPAETGAMVAAQANRLRGNHDASSKVNPKIKRRFPDRKQPNFTGSNTGALNR